MLALGGAAFSAYRYESAHADRILPGVTIAGVDVGGMTRGEAVAAVRGGAAVHLGATMTVTAGDRTWTVTPQQLGQRAGVADAVGQALALNDSMGVVSRFWHRFRSEPVDQDIDLALRRRGWRRGVRG